MAVPLPTEPLRGQLGVSNEPDPSLVKDTTPNGTGGKPKEVSVTVAVQVVGLFAATLIGIQLTPVDVDRPVTVRLKIPELAEWTRSLL